MVCSGYQRDRIFINAGTATEVRKDLTKSLLCGKEVDCRRTTLPPTAESRNCSLVATECHTASDRHFSQEIIPHALYRQQLLNAYLCQFVPAWQSGAKEERSWLALLPEYSISTRALEVSIMALCMAKLGRKNDDSILVRESLGLYSQGLHEMQLALWDPRLMYRDETMGACMALAMYELEECPSANRRAYASHQNGCAKLVMLRGPEAHSSGLGHQIFLAFRKQSVCPYLSTRDSAY